MNPWTHREEHWQIFGKNTGRCKITRCKNWSLVLAAWVIGPLHRLFLNLEIWCATCNNIFKGGPGKNLKEWKANLLLLSLLCNSTNHLTSKSLSRNTGNERNIQMIRTKLIIRYILQVTVSNSSTMSSRKMQWSNG